MGRGFMGLLYYIPKLDSCITFTKLDQSLYPMDRLGNTRHGKGGGTIAFCQPKRMDILDRTGMKWDGTI